jgi:hypothetical protein
MSEWLHLLRRESRGVSVLRQIYLAYRSQPRFVAELIAALRRLDPDAAARAAWLLDRAAREGLVDESLLPAIARAAEEATDWITRAHLCHVFSVTGCPSSLREAVFPFLQECIRDPHASIRCWALSAMIGFADDPAYAADVAEYVAQARHDPNKATQARLRQLGLVPYPPKTRPSRDRRAALSRPR